MKANSLVYNINRLFVKMGKPMYPTAQQLAQLHKASELSGVPVSVSSQGEGVQITLPDPMLPYAVVNIVLTL